VAPGECGGGGPSPGPVEFEVDISAAAGDFGSDVQDPVAEGSDFAACGVGVVGEPDQFGSGSEIGCREDDLKPGGVGLEVVAGKFRSPMASAWRIRSSTLACCR
jgi:hypothetical protein